MPEAEPDRMRSRQRQLNKMGASRLALMMAACEVDELAAAGLALGLALLRLGNDEVQRTMHAVLLGEGDRELRPYDGSAGGPERSRMFIHIYIYMYVTYKNIQHIFLFCIYIFVFMFVLNQSVVGPWAKRVFCVLHPGFV